ncbi:MAG TPA: SLC13 family permease [Silvibacterium sp.]|nr:SLC13 family permease [Silvibacterium sp.]
MNTHLLVWVISAASIALMLFRPFGLPEVVWTVAGAALLCVLRLVPLRLAGHAVAEGLDVYLFLTGMMFLSELAKVYGVFDWLANIAVKQGKGSPVRLFTLIYAVGIVVTVFMSNDATAVVLTPAVLTAVNRAQARPMPYLLSCAMIANAASFVLPISNPANLVVFHNAMPPLVKWLAMFAFPSFVSITVTYGMLLWYNRGDLRGATNGTETGVELTGPGRISLIGIFAVAAVLLAASALKWDLGLPTCVSALVVAVIVLMHERSSPRRIVSEISWSVLPLVAALFVIVEGVKSAGALAALHQALLEVMKWSPAASAYAAGGAIGLGTNLVNNLPLGLLAGATLQTESFHQLLSKVVLIAIDLGPNLSITGSLATILWLIAIRREGMNVSGWEFLKAGMLVMPTALALTLAASLLFDAL